MTGQSEEGLVKWMKYLTYTCAKKSVMQPVRTGFNEVNEIPDIYLCNEVDQTVRARVGEVNKICDIYMCN